MPMRPDMLEKIRALSREYAAALPHVMEDIGAIWSEDGPPQARLERLRMHVHTLAGNGATMGFPEISQLASSIESVLDVEFNARTMGEVEHLLGRLREAAERAKTG